MALPSIYDAAQAHLFSDRDKMAAAGLPAATINHLLRIRDIYNYWLSFPSKRDRDIVAQLRSRYGIGDTVAREDLRLIKRLLGDFQKTSKDYKRYRFEMMVTKAYDKADAQNNTRDMVAAAAQYAKYGQLDKEDERAAVIDKLVPMALRFTDDPAVIGIPRMPGSREKIKKMKEKYWSEATEEVDFEEIDAGLDDIFKPLPPYATDSDADPAGLP